MRPVRIKDLGFQGNGCAISKASASMMTAYLKGKTIDEVKEIFTEFHGMVRGEIRPERPRRTTWVS